MDVEGVPGLVFGYWNQRVILENGPESSDGWGKKSSVDCRLAANLGIKSVSYRGCFGALLYQFLRVCKNGVGLRLFPLSGLISFRSGSVLAVPSF